MEFYVLNKAFETTFFIDSYISAIWTDRYYEAGDFELYLDASTEMRKELKRGYYLWFSGSEHLMIIESIAIESDPEDGDKLVVSGRSLESILDRRVLWQQYASTGKVQDTILDMLDQSFIDPKDDTGKSVPARKISNFVIQRSTNSYITGLSMSRQCELGENLCDAIVNICKVFSIGYSIILTADNTFQFTLYYGIDRSYNQDVNPYVVFSPNFENVNNVRYEESDAEYKNSTMIIGGSPDQGTGWLTWYDSDDSAAGLERREIYTEARDLERDDFHDTDGVKGADLYDAAMKQKGIEDLLGYPIKKTFDGEVDTVNSFQYGTDFFMGDVVQIEDAYGSQASARVIEFIFSQDENGYKAYPTFEIIS